MSRPIASVSDVTIHEAYWAPVSAGEYDRRGRTVSVNLTVVDAVQARHGHEPSLITAAILAHERVHVDATRNDLPHEEERRAREAAIAAAGIEVVTHIEQVLAEAWT
ncbi:MAG TPA: hypothetical protein VMF13_01920 [Luteitalea sp.]|nr:hypothetical protein [Luteitalea sp.]